MRFYQYVAKDKTGRAVRGTIQATTPDEVHRVLNQSGFTLEDLKEVNAASPRSVPPIPSGSPTHAHPASTPYSYTNAAPSNAASGPVSGAIQIHHTRAGTDKERYFLFSQLASAFRAGLNAAQAFTEVSHRTAGVFAPSLETAALATSQGKQISEVFAQYPDLYPEHVVGVVRAGELAGFLPEALEEVARQAESAHAFNRWFFWVWFLIINFLLSIPGMWITTRGLMNFQKSTDQNGGVGANGAPMSIGEGTQGFLVSMLREALWPWGPITVGAYFFLWAFRRYFSSRVAKHYRHSLGLKIPIYGVRARHENLARFSWTMSRVSRAGISPARAWQLSAESVPNLAFRDRVANIGSQLTGSEKMSDIVFRSQLFPEEYAPMVATAEYTGDLPGAMQQLSNVSAGEFVAAQNYAKARSSCFGALGCFVTSGIMLAMLWYTWYHEIPSAILKDTDTP